MRFRTRQLIDFHAGGLLLSVLRPLVWLLGIVMRRNHAMAGMRGCAVIKMVGAGSLFQAMPALQAIRAQFPEGRFHLVGTAGVTGFARQFGWFDSYSTIDESSLLRTAVTSLRAWFHVATRCDHAIDLEVHSRLTTAFTVLTLVRNRIGFVNEVAFWRRSFYTHMTFFNVYGPVWAFYDLLAAWFGIDRVDVTAVHGRLRAAVAAHPLGAAAADLPARYVAVGHACSDFGIERQLRPQEWARVLAEPVANGLTPVFLGAAGDHRLADAIIAAVGCGVNLCGRLDIKQSSAVILRAEAFYGIDSLLIHLARALGVPCVSFWGPTDPAMRLRPRMGRERVVYQRITCAPCIHVHETPPCHGTRDCIALALASYRAEPPAEHLAADGTSTGWSVGPDGRHVTRVEVRHG